MQTKQKQIDKQKKQQTTNKQKNQTNKQTLKHVLLLQNICQVDG